MAEVERKHPRRLLFTLIALLTLTQAGCLLALAGAAGGAAATGYFFYKGRICRDYPANLLDVHNAVRAALLDLHFYVFKDQTKDGKAVLVTRTTNGKKVRIHLDCLSSPIPADGLLTRVSIRVGAFGDENVSARIFQQTAWRLSHPAPIATAPPGAPPPGAPPPGAPPPPLQPTGFQTTEPKPAPVKKN